MINRLIVLICVVMSMCACDNGLSRSSAEKVLSSALMPLTLYIEQHGPVYSVASNYANDLLAKGYLKQGANIISAFVLEGYQITDKAKPFLYGNNDSMGLLLANVANIKVTGISKPGVDMNGSNVTIVQFEVTYELTSLGKALSAPPELVRKGEAGFVKFDDGWRLDGLNYKGPRAPGIKSYN